MNRFSKFSIKKQFNIVLTYLFIFCFCLAVFTYISLNQLLLKNANAYSQTQAQKFDSEVDYLFERIDSIYSSLQFDKNIAELMINPYTEKAPTNIKNIHVQISFYSIMNKDITDIALVNDNLHWSNYYNRQSLDEMATQLENIRGTTSLGLLEKISLFTTQSSVGPRLIFGRNFYNVYEDNDYGKKLGSIIISIDPSKSIAKLPENKKYLAYYILANSTSTICPFNCSKELSEQILTSCEVFPLNSQEKSFEKETRDYLIYATYIPTTGYYAVSIFDRRAMNKDVLSTTIAIVMSIILTLLVFVYLMRIILRSMVKPINKLHLYIHKIKQSNYHLPQKELELYGCKEVNVLSKVFNEMLHEQTRLSEDLHETTVHLYETKLGKTQAELDFLRSQINPHFLYNTLEIIKDISLENNVTEIATIASAMGKLFRYNVKGTSIVPLSEEIEITKAYLDIQQARFSEKFEVIYSILDNTLKIPVMKFFLQPLVENAIFHGLEKKSEKGLLFIGTRLDNNVLIITVQDDGIGIEPGILEMLQAQLDGITPIGPDVQHIGILNIQHRIKLQYGVNYGVQIESIENEGTKVVLKIPALANDLLL